ncbi:MAG: hypothetical protein E7212_15175 [Clostridium sartagoforme]|nr:hypothetical protein [Clostridium sartagoforme]
MESKEIKKQEYLKRFKAKVYTDDFKEFAEPEVKELGDEIINLLKEKELAYVDAYVTLEYVYRYLQLMSEYTHL